MSAVLEPDPTIIERTPPTEIEHVFRAHYDRLVRSLTLACGDAELAADAVQEAFVRAHVRWRRLRHYEDPVGWVRRVAINLLRDQHRRTSARTGRSPAWPPRRRSPLVRPSTIGSASCSTSSRGNSARRSRSTTSKD